MQRKCIDNAYAHCMQNAHAILFNFWYHLNYDQHFPFSLFCNLFEIMHRDIAARNLLLSDNMRAYIADMGLSRVLQGENPKIENVGAGPIRWYQSFSIVSNFMKVRMAYESLNESIHTFQSDGIHFYELYYSFLIK